MVVIILHWLKIDVAYTKDFFLIPVKSISFSSAVKPAELVPGSAVVHFEKAVVLKF